MERDFDLVEMRNGKDSTVMHDAAFWRSTGVRSVEHTFCGSITVEEKGRRLVFILFIIV